MDISNLLVFVHNIIYTCMSFNEVIVKGGLGNQLFFLFYAYKLLLCKNKVSLNCINYSLSNRKDRVFVLEHLYPEIKSKFIIEKTIKSYYLLLFSKFFEKVFYKSKLDRLPGDNPISFQYWPNSFIHSGYFQEITNSELDKKSLDLLKRDLNPFLDDFKSKFLAIHIRRGDFLNKKHSMHGLISEYSLFKESKKQISKDTFDGITIFSDSPESVDLNIFKSLHNNVVIDKGGNTIDVFRRMSNHKGLVASNSSFSLWAGILGKIKYFSIPYFWMRNVKSSLIGLEHIPRYKCQII